MSDILYYETGILVDYETYGNNIYIHANFDSLTHSQYKRLLNTWVYLADILSCDGENNIYCIPPTDKVKRFAELFGFTFSHYLEDKSGEELEVMVWEQE